MAGQHDVERRRHKRVPAVASLELVLPGRPEDRIYAESIDISPGGILLSTDACMEVGSRVRIKLDLESLPPLNVGINQGPAPGNEKELVLSCRVVHVKGAEEIGFEIGLSFERILKGRVETLERLLYPKSAITSQSSDKQT